MRFPDFTLSRDTGEPVSLADQAGRPWIAYLARHPG
jgi:peroxiredoxin